MLIPLIILLLLINALFVMAEMALVSSRKARLQARAERGNRGAKMAFALALNPTKFLSTTQIGITLIGILMGAFGEAAIAERLAEQLHAHGLPHARPIAIALTVLVLTYCTLIIAELVPKRIGQSKPETIAGILAAPMTWLARVGAPLVWLLTASTELVLKLIPLPKTRDHEETEEEVIALLASGTQTGVFHKSEQDIVERVFRLSDQRVKAIMVPRPDIDYLSADDDIERVRVIVATSSHSHFPVCGTHGSGLDDLLGYVHVKDLVKHGLISETINLRDLCHPPMFVPESMPALKVLDQFRDTGTHLAFVIDEYGALVGLVTLSDVLVAILGEVTTESKHEEPEIVKRADGSFLLDGMLAIEDLKDLMDVEELPREDEAGYDTLGGFVMSTLGRIPAAGDSFELGRFIFEVMDMDRTRVDKVLLTQKPNEPAAQAEHKDE